MGNRESRERHAKPMGQDHGPGYPRASMHSALELFLLERGASRHEHLRTRPSRLRKTLGVFLCAVGPCVHFLQVRREKIARVRSSRA